MPNALSGYRKGCRTIVRAGERIRKDIAQARFIIIDLRSLALRGTVVSPGETKD